jgi:5,10-methenyltetrahydrofolate synthetase
MTSTAKQQIRKKLAQQFPVCSRPVSINLDSYEMILSFIPMRDEPDVSPVNQNAMEKGIPVAIPSKQPGTYIPLNGTEDEPVFSVSEVSVKTLMLVPGVAFTSDGYRLGRGGGWYDRALENAPACIETVGICAKERLLPELPVEPHDKKVNKVLVV